VNSLALAGWGYLPRFAAVRGGYPKIICVGVLCLAAGVTAQQFQARQNGQRDQKPVAFPKVEQEEFFLQAIEALQAGNTNAVLELVDRAVGVDVTNRFAYVKRAQLLDIFSLDERAVKDYSIAISYDPTFADVYQLRGCSHFKAGRLDDAVADWNTFLSLKPEKEALHWQICVAYALQGQFNEGRNQFEWHWTANTKDVEVALWHFMCTARLDGLDKARAAMIEVKLSEDKRVPMEALYNFYAGKLTEADVWLAVEQGAPDDAERAKREFFANYYIGVHRQAEGKLAEAREFVGKALGVAYRNEGFIGDSPGGQLRAGDMARVHLGVLDTLIKDAAALAAAQSPEAISARRRMMFLGVAGLAGLIGLGVFLQRRRPKIAVKPELAEPELAEKSST
jgi:lipoprotein NlpI